MKVRSVNITDKPAWLALRRRLAPALDDRAHERDWTRMMDERGRRATLVCVDDDGAVLGMLEVSRRVASDVIASGPVGWVETLHVEPGAHREQSARELTDAAARWAQTRGCRALGADTSLDNQWAQKLHLDLGFEEIARKVIYRKALQIAPPRAADSPVEIGVSRPALQVATGAAAAESDAGPSSTEWPSWWPGPVRAGIIVLGLVCLYFTDLFSGSVFFGVVLPMIDVVFVVYLLVLFVDMKYRRKTGADARHLELLQGSNDGE